MKEPSAYALASALSAAQVQACLDALTSDLTMPGTSLTVLQAGRRTLDSDTERCGLRQAGRNADRSGHGAVGCPG